MTTPENPIGFVPVPRVTRTDRDLAAAIVTAANLPAGRWAVSVRTEHDDRLGETLVSTVASVRVHATIHDEDVSQADYVSTIQGVAARIARELRGVIDAHDVELETTRRLHEAATESNATLRTTLEGLVEASKWYRADNETDELDAAIAKAREALA